MSQREARSHHARIALIYHSGTGSTKLISELIANQISREHQIELIPVEEMTRAEKLETYDVFVFGFPTFHLKPTPSMTEFVDLIPPFSEPKPAFVFTTLALYAENANRLLAEHLLKKNLLTLDSIEVRGPASDASLAVHPSLIPNYFLSYEKQTIRKIRHFTENINFAAKTKGILPRIPKEKWYTWIAQVFQLLHFNNFENNKYRIRIDTSRCNLCENCINVCDRGCWTPSSSHPIFAPENCEFCVRCVHHCPTKAIVIWRWNHKGTRLNTSFYRRAKRQLISELNQTKSTKSILNLAHNLLKKTLKRHPI